MRQWKLQRAGGGRCLIGDLQNGNDDEDVCSSHHNFTLLQGIEEFFFLIVFPRHVHNLPKSNSLGKKVRESPEGRDQMALKVP